MIHLKRHKFSSWLKMTWIPMILFNTACKKLDIEKIDEEIRYIRNREEATFILDETYSIIKGSIDINSDGTGDFFYTDYILSTALYSGEAIYKGSESSWSQFEDHTLNPNNKILSELWFTGYRILDNVNIILRDVPHLDDLSSDEKDELIGQASAIRAFINFILVNLFENIPLVTVSLTNSEYPAQSAKSDIYEQIISDLQVSNTLLSAENITDKEAVNQQVAEALLARVFLYTQQWQDALEYANKIIQSGLYTLDTNYSEAFLNTSSKEIIWKLDYRSSNDINVLGYYTFPADSGGIFEYRPANEQINAFEANDKRKSYCINSIDDICFIAKYKDPAEGKFDIPLIRYSEIVFIAAEAQHQLGDRSSASDHINVVRSRAELQNLPVDDITSDTILHELMCEFAYEGHRWLDINRYDKATEIIGKTDNDFLEHQLLWPIPQEALDKNMNLVQNPGY